MLERTLSLKPPASLCTTGVDAFLHPHVYIKKYPEFCRQTIHKTHTGRTPHSYVCDAAVKMAPSLPSKSGCAVRVANITASWSVPPRHASMSAGHQSVTQAVGMDGWSRQGCRPFFCYNRDTTYGTAQQRPVTVIY